jgi:hypothetical protein
MSRLERLREFIDHINNDTRYSVNEDCPAREPLDSGEEPEEQWAGWHFGDGGQAWAFLGTREEVAEYMADETQGDYAWGPAEAMDLDTGVYYDAHVKVELIRRTVK